MIIELNDTITQLWVNSIFYYCIFTIASIFYLPVQVPWLQYIQAVYILQKIKLTYMMDPVLVDADILLFTNHISFIASIDQ